MTGKPKVLIFDDDSEWAVQIAIPLEKKFNVTHISRSDYWNQYLLNSLWDAIIVDVHILGDDLSGPEHAMKSILKYYVTVPMTIISNVVNLKDVEKQYGRIFYGYMHKDNCIEELPPLVEAVCSIESSKEHIKKMTTEIARQNKILDYEFPKEWIDDKVIRETFTNSNMNTIRDLISMSYGGTKAQLADMGKVILIVITNTIDQNQT